MTATSLTLDPKVHQRLAQFKQNHPLKLSQRQIITEAIYEYLDRHEHDHIFVQQMLEKHRSYTGSPVADRLLSEWNKEKSCFVRVMPLEYKKVLEKVATTGLKMDTEVSDG